MTPFLQFSITVVGSGGVEDEKRTQISRKHQLLFVQQNVAASAEQLATLLTEKGEEQIDIIMVQEPLVQ